MFRKSFPSDIIRVTGQQRRTPSRDTPPSGRGLVLCRAGVVTRSFSAHHRSAVMCGKVSECVVENDVPGLEGGHFLLEIHGTKAYAGGGGRVQTRKFFPSLNSLLRLKTWQHFRSKSTLHRFLRSAFRDPPPNSSSAAATL